MLFVMFFLGRERPSDLLVKALRMADGEQFEDPTLLSHSADIYMKSISIEDLRSLLAEAEGHHEICQAAARGTEDEFIEETTSWARGLELTVEKDDPGPTREALICHLKFWSSLLFVGTVRLF